MPAAGATRYSAPSQGERILIERGGRLTAVRLPRHGVLAVGGVLVLAAVWSLGAAGYMIFHDTVVAELRAGASASARGYQAQIAAMRDELEHARTRRMVEKSGLDDRFGALLERQAAVEKRQDRLDALADLGAGDAQAEIRGDGSSSLKPSPIEGTNGAPALRPSTTAEKVSASFDAIELDQARTLEGLAIKASDRRKTLERVYDAARVRRPQLADGHGRGGPFEPLPPGAMTFETRADEVQAERAVVAAFERGLTRVPVRLPVPAATISSGFGARPDPFLGRVAFHAGVDFEREQGEPARATAAGRVTNAQWSGGYGLMVEIDHGGGLVTRYGHLSSILVKEGDEVGIGAVVGRVGSTGRSTGPHLHYETRVNSEAVDPMRFLNAGRLLAAK